jgi:hypothetical protein
VFGIIGGEQVRATAEEGGARFPCCSADGVLTPLDAIGAILKRLTAVIQQTIHQEFVRL